jgi:hypothetical protein
MFFSFYCLSAGGRRRRSCWRRCAQLQHAFQFLKWKKSKLEKSKSWSLFQTTRSLRFCSTLMSIAPDTVIRQLECLPIGTTWLKTVQGSPIIRSEREPCEGRSPIVIWPSEYFVLVDFIHLLLFSPQMVITWL